MKLDIDMKKRAFAARLKEAVKAKGMDEYGMYSAIARHFKLTPRAVQKWFLGESIPHTRIDELANYLSVRPEWLRTGIGAMREVDAKFADGALTSLELHVVPIIEADQYQLWMSDKLDKAQMPTVVATGTLPPKAFCILVNDNSLYDKVLKDMHVVVDPERTAQPGEMSVAILNNSFVMGYLVKRGRFFMDPPNTSFTSIDLGEAPNVIGVLVQAVSKPLTTS